MGKDIEFALRSDQCKDLENDGEERYCVISKSVNMSSNIPRTWTDNAPEAIEHAGCLLDANHAGCENTKLLVVKVVAVVERKRNYLARSPRKGDLPLSRR